MQDSAERIKTVLLNNQINRRKTIMKKIIGIIAVVAVVMIASYNIYKSEKKVNLSNLALANVEALAGGEEGQTPDGRKLYEHHCGSGVGTQCKPLGITGNSCPVERSCP